MADLSEKYLGKRVVHYLRNEAMVGRINQQKVQAFASILGVASYLKPNIQDIEDGQQRSEVMSKLLEEWCLSAGHPTEIDVTSLSSALEQARLKYHAQTVRNISLEPSSADSIKAPVNYTPTSSSNGSSVKSKRRPPPPRSKRNDNSSVQSSTEGNSQNPDRASSEGSIFGNSPRPESVRTEIGEVKQDLSAQRRNEDSGLETSPDINQEGMDDPPRKSQRKLKKKTSTREKKSKEKLSGNKDSEKLDGDEKLENGVSPIKHSPKKSPSKRLKVRKESKVDENENISETTKDPSSTDKATERISSIPRSTRLSPKKSPTKRSRSPSKQKRDDTNSVLETENQADNLKDSHADTVQHEQDTEPGSSAPLEKKTKKGKHRKSQNTSELETPSEDSSPKKGLPKKSPKKQLISPTKQPSSPTKQPSSPTKQPGSPTKQLGSPKKQLGSPKKQLSSPKKQLSSSTKQSESSTKQEESPRKQRSSPTKHQRRVKKPPSETNLDSPDSDIDDEVDNKDKSAGKKSKNKSSDDVIFSDDETDFPTRYVSGMSLRRKTYLDVLALEKDRRESIRSKGTGDVSSGVRRELEKTVSDKRWRKKYGVSDPSGKSNKNNQEQTEATKNKGPDLIEIGVRDIMNEEGITSSAANYDRNRDTMESLIKKKIREDPFLRSFCLTEQWILHNLVRSMIRFGPLIKIYTKTQVMFYIVLFRLSKHTSAGKQLGTEKELLNDPETMAFARELCKLCYDISRTEQVIVSGVVDQQGEDSSSALLSFEQFDVMISKLRLESFGIATFQERGPYFNDVGNFVECNFSEKLMVEFLATIHLHVFNEDVNEITKTKLVRILPYLCGIATEEVSEGQRVCSKFLNKISDEMPERLVDDYLRHLNSLWLESPVTFLHCCHEARMKKIYVLPPPNEKHICVVQTKLAIHDIVALTYYLEHFDVSVINPESLLIQDCGLTDEALFVLGKKLWRVKKVQLTGCLFTHKGLGELTRKVNDQDLTRVEILDLSDCQLDDDALIRIMPVFGHVKELYISDNSFTWYGIRKLASVQRRTKNLKKLDMSRCQLSEHGFFELIPILLKTEHVILQGNPISPLELKIFSRQIRDSKKLTLKILDISSSSLDDSCLYQIAKFVFFIETVDLHNSNFGLEGIKMLVKCQEKFGLRGLKVLNMRMCKLNDEGLTILSEIIPHLNSVILSSNNFSGSSALKSLAESINNTESPSLKHIDLRHCRISEANKKLMNETCRKHKIDLKIW